jgi:DNA-binding transcriptional ArsR family regulator
LLKANTVFVDEGEKDVHSLEALGLTATCNPGGALKWRREFNKHFQGKAVVILPDNDPPDKNHPEGVGRAHAQQVARHLHGMAASVKVVELPGLPDHGDVSDWLKAGGTKEKLLALVETAPEWKPTPHQAERPKTAPQQLAQARKGHPIQFVSGKELETLDFPEPVWIIPNILGEGYIILAGRPKLGKSWLGLCLAVAVATGGCALGKGELRATQGKVLYLALEDRLRRIKKRLGQIMCGSPFPENLLLAESWQRLDKGGLEDLRLFLREHDDCRMVVIDTLAKVCPPRTKNRDLYEFDMSVGGSLQALANQFRVSILVVHHTRKSEANDPLDEVSGSTGVTGAADAVMVLKRGRGQADGTLTLAGRDIEEQELALQFRPQEGLWELLGDAAEYSMSQERHEVLSILREIGPKTPAQLSKILDKKRENIKKLLLKMKDSGLVIANKKGEYKTLSI